MCGARITALESIMTNLALTNYYKEIDAGNVISSFQTLKTLYNLTDDALAEIANKFSDTDETLNLESDFLRDKYLLITLAAKTQCKNMHEISGKVDFLKRVHLDEKRPDDFSLTDELLKSIWEDCEIYL